MRRIKGRVKREENERERRKRLKLYSISVLFHLVGFPSTFLSVVFTVMC